MIFGSLQTLAAFVITLGILVSIHEFGHFWVARKCGVKVLRFSVGFGKPLWTWTDRLGTEYVVALIPLGGYVKMLDEREGPVAESERHESFNSKPVLSRIAIVAAGPIANFILAVFALWLMYMAGIRTIVPQVGSVLPDSPAAVAGIIPGDEIVSIDGEETPGWQQVNLELLSSIGDTRNLSVATRAGVPGELSSAAVRNKTVAISDWLVDDSGDGIADPVRALGIEPYTPLIPAVLGELSPDGAARAAGLQAGDRILTSNGQPVKDWLSWVQVIRANAGKTIQVELEREGRRLNLALTPGTRELNGEPSGYIGAGVQQVGWPDDMVRKLQFNPVAALPKALDSTWTLTSMTVESLWKMVAGLVSVKNLSGPITIAKVAGASLQSGLENFLYFLSMLSVSLGVLNLLPIPVLDGGHLLFYLIELVRGKPVSERVQVLGLKIGVTFVVGIMMLALYNDLSRLF
ncbi:zinc metallopeptidase RseP [Endozoicomonas montiporae]|uniref:Zinc metalloprotease n=2 Tax=Endozoicomonas montiporae TaxID=1027273 RepID=A0A081NBN2_9GAMM|nr:sigma E protease regulator RseP [Endozoicomonas montiporae]AMO56149.1 peptidase RseP [Endozoicomonas montiporae CL-33]KEQ15855.1 zinc metallopeptidase RseP [Endozoicomonas montiporae]